MPANSFAALSCSSPITNSTPRPSRRGSLPPLVRHCQHAALSATVRRLTAPLHGGAWQSVRSLIARAAAIGAEEAVRSYLPRDGHCQRSATRSIRTAMRAPRRCLACFTLPPLFAEVRNVAEELVGERVNVDFALTATTYRLSSAARRAADHLRTGPHGRVVGACHGAIDKRSPHPAARTLRRPTVE